MRKLYTAAALALLAVGPSLAAAQTFSTPLSWVPIGGAERSDVSGEGVVTAKLNGTRLSIEGSFEGLPAQVTGARLHEGVAKGARGTAPPTIAELSVSGVTSGRVSGDVRLSADQVGALKAGRLFVQIYSEKGVPPDHGTLWGWLAEESRR